MVPGFTARYGAKHLVWFQGFDDIRDAIDDEKRLKRWRREWKIKLIEASNPTWEELHPW
jgi:putative endonuclease